MILYSLLKSKSNELVSYYQFMFIDYELFVDVRQQTRKINEKVSNFRQNDDLRCSYVSL